MGFMLRLFVGSIALLIWVPNNCTSLQRQENATFITAPSSSGHETKDNSVLNRTNYDEDKTSVKNVTEKKLNDETWDTNSVIVGDFNKHLNERTTEKHNNSTDLGENPQKSKYGDGDNKFDYFARLQSPSTDYTKGFSSETERYFHDFEKYSMFDDDDFHHSYETTPEYYSSKTEDFFDVDAHESSINAKTAQDEFKEMSPEKYVDSNKKNGTDKKIDIDFVTIKKIEMNNGNKNGNSIRKNVVTQKRTTVVTSFTKTIMDDDEEPEYEEDEDHTENHDKEESHVSPKYEMDDKKFDASSTERINVLTKPSSHFDTSSKSSINSEKTSEKTNVESSTKLKRVKQPTSSVNTVTNDLITERAAMMENKSITDTKERISVIASTEHHTTTPILKRENVLLPSDVVTKLLPSKEKKNVTKEINVLRVTSKFSERETITVPSVSTNVVHKSTTSSEVMFSEASTKKSTSTTTVKVTPKSSNQMENVELTVNRIPVTKSRETKVSSTTLEPTRFKSTYVSRRLSDTTKPGLPNWSTTSESTDAVVLENRNVLDIQVAPSDAISTVVPVDEDITIEPSDVPSTEGNMYAQRFRYDSVSYDLPNITEIYTEFATTEITTVDSVENATEISDAVDLVTDSSLSITTASVEANNEIPTTSQETVTIEETLNSTEEETTVITTTETIPEDITTGIVEDIPTTIKANIRIINENTPRLLNDHSSTPIPDEYDDVEEEYEKKHFGDIIPTEEPEIDVFHSGRNRNDHIETTQSTVETTTNFELQGTENHDDKGTIAAITISCVAAVCLVALAVLLVMMRKRQKRFNNRQRCTPVSLDAYSVDNVSVYNSVRRKGLRSSKRSFGNPAFEDPISVTHPLNFQGLVKFALNLDDIKSEFEEVPQITARMMELPDGCDIKNRYANVIPLPETRVMLNPIAGVPTSDYINANYVTGPKGTRGYYIATQAPLPNTIEDFWRMIWEQESKVVLMLTHLFENGVEKCIDYLPPSEVTDCQRVFGDFQLTLKNREVKEKYIISSLQLKNMVSNSWRDLTHLWYLGWPEKDVPAEANSLIAFLIEARSFMKTPLSENNNKISATKENGKIHDISPMVVHCSPGTGRTGTVIACDIAIREFELFREVDIPKIVYRIRRDRASSVQTKEQYAFIYKVISLYATKLTGGVLDSL